MTRPSYDDPPRPVESVHAVELDGELVLYNAATNRAARLDPRASLIWRVLDGTVTVAELVDDLSDVFETDRDVVRVDVASMLAELHDLGFLAPAEAPTASTAEDHVLPDPPSP